MASRTRSEGGFVRGLEASYATVASRHDGCQGLTREGAKGWVPKQGDTKDLEDMCARAGLECAWVDMDSCYIQQQD